MNGEAKKQSQFYQLPEACPACMFKFDKIKANLVKSTSDSMVVHVTCPKCQTSVLSSISLNNLGVFAVGILTDLTKEDLMLLKNNKLITADDVIEMHEYIEKKGYINFQ